MSVDIIRNIRMSKGITQKKLCKGLCSISKISLIEKGNRIPDFFLRLRLLKRMGFSSVKQVFYLQPDEYDLWNHEQKLMEAIKSNDSNIAYYHWHEIDKELDEEKIIIRQFLCDMSGILFYKRRLFSAAYDEYQKAIELTMPGITYDNMNEYIIAPIEYYYLIMRLKCECELQYNTDRINDFYINIIDHIDKATMDPGTKSEIYPYAVNEYFKFLNNNPSYKKITNKILVETALELLRECSKTFFLKEILLYKMGDLDHIIEKNENQETENWIEALNYLYSLVDYRDNDEKFSFFLYCDISCQSLAYIVKERRRVYKITQNDLAEGICSVKTLRRVEQGKVNSQKEVYEKLLKKMAIYNSFRYEEIITDDWRLVKLAKEFRSNINDKNLAQAERICDEIERLIDKTIPCNSQIILRNKALLKKCFGKEGRYQEDLMDALSQTIPYDALFHFNGGYLTEGELNCLYSIVQCDELNPEIAETIKDVFKKIVLDDSLLLLELKAILMRWIGIQYAEKDNYSIASQYAVESIKSELMAYKIHTAYYALYDIGWNSAKVSGLTDGNVKIKLKACYYLADLFKDRATAAFFNKKYNAAVTNDNSWIE